MITPINGGQLTIGAPTKPKPGGVLSPQYVRLNNLESRPTEWVPGGRPIYKRLPSSGQTYQVSFDADGSIGYVYIPPGGSLFGVNSLEVLASDNFKEIVIQGGTIIWAYGSSRINPAILNIQDIDIRSGRYFLGYELIYDDTELYYQYETTDYYLYGETLNITSSSDDVMGWRYPPSNAFTPEAEFYWKNSDNFFPDYAQPSESYITWASESPSAYSTVKVRMPKDVVVPSDVVATLSYNIGSTGANWVDSASATIQYDSGQGFFLIKIDEPTFQTNWRISWSSGDGSPYLPIVVDSIEISGIISLLSRPSGPVPRATLVMYPQNTVPTDSTLCQLAWVDINPYYEVTEIIDARNTTDRNYVPVADWLTRPWDENLIRLYEQVDAYSTLWMSPTVAMDFEYETLTSTGITVT